MYGMKKLLVSVGVIICLFLAWIAWRLQPWMQDGKLIQIGSWKYEAYEFQVWQRKNSTFAEPFSTSLYVRHKTNAWHQYYLNHQDDYSPNISLTKKDLSVLVYRGTKFLGAYNMAETNYAREGGDGSLEDVFWEDPPGNRNRQN